MYEYQRARDLCKETCKKKIMFYMLHDTKSLYCMNKNTLEINHPFYHLVFIIIIIIIIIKIINN